MRGGGGLSGHISNEDKGKTSNLGSWSWSWSTAMTSVIFLFKLVHLNNLFCNIVKKVDVKRVLKSSIFVVQKATAPKTGVEFRQGSIGAIRISLATSYDVWRRRATS